MSSNPLGFSSPRLGPRPETPTEYLLVQRTVQRLLNFLGLSIDDVCNDPIAKNQVYCYYKLYRQVERSTEVTELERQWNRVGI